MKNKIRIKKDVEIDCSGLKEINSEDEKFFKDYFKTLKEKKTQTHSSQNSIKVGKC